MTFIQNLMNDVASTDLYLLVISTAIACTIVLLIFAFSKTKKAHISENKKPNKPLTVITSHDIKAIAGEDILSTQLDLARAYIEMDKKSLAKKILKHVLQNGNGHQQQEARQLMSALEMS